MSQRVRGPGCREWLHYGNLLDGKPGVCPACGYLVMPPERDADEGTQRSQATDANRHAIIENPKQVRSASPDPPSLRDVRPLDG